VSVRFTRSGQEIIDADLAIIPGTKATVEDLKLLRSQGLDEAFAERDRRRLPILGICGGYQMLGGRIEDGVESPEACADGLGLLPVETTFEAEKVLNRPEGGAPGFDDAAVSGYEIHHGRIKRSGGEALFGTDDIAEGCRIGATLGTSWHGVLESDDFRRAFLTWIAAENNLDWRPGDQSFATAREAQLEKLGDLIADNVDRDALMRLIDEGQTERLPIVRHQASGIRHQQGDSNGAPVAENVRPAGAGTTSLASAAAMDATQANLRPET
jgi:adenosylcobyric acid synthase